VGNLKIEERSGTMDSIKEYDSFHRGADYTGTAACDEFILK
jgi:hypothetical protein